MARIKIGHLAFLAGQVMDSKRDEKRNDGADINEKILKIAHVTSAF